MEEKKPEEPDASLEGPAEVEANKPPIAEPKTEASGESSAASPAQAPPTWHCIFRWCLPSAGDPSGA